MTDSSTATLERENRLWRHAVAAHQRLGFLSEASRVLSESLETPTILANLARLAVPKVAHWCFIDLINESGELELVGNADVDARSEALLGDLRRRFPPNPRTSPIHRVARAGEARLLARADHVWLNKEARSPERLRLLRRLGRGPYVCAPLKAGARTIGTLTFGCLRGREMTSADLELGRELGARAGMAIEHARLYDKARRSDEMLARALTASQMVAWTWDLATGVVRRSDNMRQIYGLDADREIGRGLDLIHPDDRSRYQAVLAKAAADLCPFTARFRMVRQDGSIAWMEEHGSASHAPDGAAQLSGVVMDITERKVAEDELRLQGEVSRILGDSSSAADAFPLLLAAIGEALGWTVGFAWLAENGALRKVGTWPGACIDRRSTAGEGLVGAAWTTGRAAWACGLEKASSRLSCAFAFPILGTAETIGVFEFYGDGVSDVERRFSGLFERLGRQIGLWLERRRAQAQLERQRREQQAILDSVPAMIWYKDDKNRVLRVNRAAASWYGQPVECLQGRSAEELFPERGREYAQDDLAVIRSGEPKLGMIEECLSPAGTKRWVRRDLIPHHDELGRPDGVIIFAVDITDIQRAQEVLRESEKAQRDFVANVSHEFRTPVAAIKGFAETLRRGGLEDKDNRLSFVRTIESQADRLDWMVQDLLNLSRLGSGMVKFKAQPLPARRFLEDYVGTVGSLLDRRRVKVEIDAPAALTVLGDRMYLVQVLDNLVGNALKHSPKGGTIRLEACREGGFARLTVRDEGDGVAAEHLPRLFDRFYRVEKGESGGSTGLGLHIVKTIVEAQGGRVWAESAVGRGCALHFTLPAA